MNDLPEDRIVEALKAYVRCASVSTDPDGEAGMEAARRFVTDALEDLGFEVQRVPTPLHPILIGTLNPDRTDWPHLLVYGHYDVQPSSPDGRWTTPPFEPEVRDGRIYGRGTADNKGPLVVHLSALRRLRERYGGRIPLRITYLVEGEEEIGSPSFPAFLGDWKDRLKGDLLFLSDTGSPSTDQLAITTALRGLVGCHVEVRGPRTDLHSGIHGGALLNPIEGLARICSSLIDPDGRVTLPGFYEDVVGPSDWERAELAKTGGSEEDYRRFLKVRKFRPAPGCNALEGVRFAPTLEFNGIGGGFQGEGTKTVIPASAFVKITCRLVANQNPHEISASLEKALREACPPQLEMSLHHHGAGWPYLVVPPDRPTTPADQNPTLANAFRSAEKRIAAVFPRPPVYLREGGSVPIIADLKRICEVDTLMIGLFTAEDNLHAPDESFDLTLMRRAIDVFEGIFSDLVVG